MTCPQRIEWRAVLLAIFMVPVIAAVYLLDRLIHPRKKPRVCVCVTEDDP